MINLIKKLVKVNCVILTLACNIGSKKESNIIETFNNIPIEIEGPACYFYLSEQDRNEGKYLFVNDFAEYGYMKINGQITKFSLVKFKEKDQSNSYYLYTNKEDTVHIEIMSNDSLLKGIIYFRNAKEVKKIKCIGECSC
jgi:hypothetical protein